jgi:hypothetical protein
MGKPGGFGFCRLSRIGIHKDRPYPFRPDTPPQGAYFGKFVRSRREGNIRLAVGYDDKNGLPAGGFKFFGAQEPPGFQKTVRERSGASRRKPPELFPRQMRAGGGRQKHLRLLPAKSHKPYPVPPDVGRPEQGKRRAFCRGKLGGGVHGIGGVHKKKDQFRAPAYADFFAQVAGQQQRGRPRLFRAAQGRRLEGREQRGIGNFFTFGGRRRADKPPAPARCRNGFQPSFPRASAGKAGKFKAVVKYYGFFAALPPWSFFLR